MSENPPARTSDAAAPRAGQMLHNVQEWIGYACAIAAAAYGLGLAPALGTAAVILVVTANMRAAAAKPARMRLADRIASALAAYRAGGTP